MTDESTYGGLFQDPTFLSSDPDPKKSDPYVKQDCIPSRYLGKSMLTGGAPCPGNFPDSNIDRQYLTLASAEQNTDVFAVSDRMEQRRLKEAAKNATKPVSDTEFRYSSYPQESTGAGSYYGTFQGCPYEHIVEPSTKLTKQEKRAAKRRAKEAAAAAKEASRVRSLPNIKTNPSKKGTYGMPGLLLSSEAYNDNWRTDADVVDKKARKAADRALVPTAIGGPFRAPGVCRAYLDEQPATGAPAVYSEYVPPLEKGRRSGRKQKEAVLPGSIHQKPFYGGNPSGGQGGCINGFLNTWHDPREADANDKKSKRRSQKKAAPMEATRPKGADEWKPNSFGHTSVITSCLRRFY